MTQTGILERIQDILRDVLQGWDSFSHVNIIWNVEQEFSVRFALGELQDLKDVGGLVDLVAQKLATRH
jgi:acyl carrier protein